jgi:CheY-like chemotaxis protein
MPFINGFEFRRMIEADKNLKLKTIPFLFLTTAADKSNIEKAFTLSIQGYFRKPVTSNEMAKMLDEVIAYWQRSERPNSTILNN